MNGLKIIRRESKTQLVYLNFTFQLPGQVQLLINVPVYLTFTNVFIPSHQTRNYNLKCFCLHL